MDRDKDEVIRDIVRRDTRYRADAYAFLLEALDFTIQRRGKGRAPAPRKPRKPPLGLDQRPGRRQHEVRPRAAKGDQRHMVALGIGQIGRAHL